MPELSPVASKFILHWGELGTRWGISRTVAQIHALLYLSNRPLHAEEICETLNLARSNVSTAVKELQNWGIVRVAQFCNSFTAVLTFERARLSVSQISSAWRGRFER